jgi:hypothetical protein
MTIEQSKLVHVCIMARVIYDHFYAPSITPFAETITMEGMLTKDCQQSSNIRIHPLKAHWARWELIGLSTVVFIILFFLKHRFSVRFQCFV